MPSSMEDINFSGKQEMMAEDNSEVSAESEGLISEIVTRPIRKRTWLRLLRISVEAGTLVLVVVLSIVLISSRPKYSRSSIQGFGPPLPDRVVIFGDDYRFGPDLVYAEPEMFYNETRLHQIYENWQSLFPKGRGFIGLKDGDDFIVDQPPYDLSALDTNNDNPHGWVISVYHSLHCLLSIVESVGMSREELRNKPEAYIEHRAHCVEYLRQTILCSADTSMEGNPNFQWNYVPGSEHKHKHVCKDYDALYDMATERAVWDVREDLLSRVQGPGN